MTSKPEKDGYQVDPGQEVVVDFFRPEDAEGVAACFHAVYGQAYPISTYVRPAELIKANQEKKVISSVARTSGGEVVGHNALFVSSPNPKIMESGAGVVIPAYRVGGLFSKMVAHGFGVAAPHFGVELVHGEPVCNHPYSQLMCLNVMGTLSMALEVDQMPAAAYSKEKSAPGRVSALLDFATLISRPHAIFFPQVYEEEISFLYEGFNDERRLEVAEGKPPAGSRSLIKTEVFSFAQVARMTAQETGEDLGEVVAREEAAAAAKGCSVFQLWLKLASPWIGDSVETLRKTGWFLGGVLPRWFDEDGMLMQKMYHQPGWDDMVLALDRAKQIAEMVRRDWERTR